MSRLTRKNITESLNASCCITSYLPARQWADAFQPDRGDGRADVAFEKAALLFNMGAIASQASLPAVTPELLFDDSLQAH